RGAFVDGFAGPNPQGTVANLVMADATRNEYKGFRFVLATLRLEYVGVAIGESAPARSGVLVLRLASLCRGGLRLAGLCSVILRLAGLCSVSDGQQQASHQSKDSVCAH